MGRYVTSSDLIPSYVEERDAVQLTNDEVDGTTVVTAVVDDVIADAEAEVDGYLGARYALPLVTVPRLVPRLVLRLARHHLYARRRGAVEEWLQKDHDAALRMLRDISEGRVTLGSQPEAAANSERMVRSTARDPVFGRANLEDF